MEQCHKPQNAPCPYPKMLHVHMSVLYDMKQVHSGTCELSELLRFQDVYWIKI